ncbi:MAG: flagellar hook-length control [Beijerinckiaceae bacterium]|nr:MAG: flagellar hook-length control [Beijerinckiaceae bacterium]
MPSDVTFSLANALSDFAAARRVDAKGVEGGVKPTGEDHQVQKASFGHLMREDQAKPRPAAEARSRSVDPRPDRPSRDPLNKTGRREGPDAAEHDRRAADDKGEASERRARPAEDRNEAERPEAKEVRATERTDEQNGMKPVAEDEVTTTAEATPEGANAEQVADTTPAATDAATDMISLLERMIDPGVADGTQTADAAQATNVAAQPTPALVGGVVTTDPDTVATGETPEGTGPVGGVTGVLSATPTDKSGPAVSVPGLTNPAEGAAEAGKTASSEPIDPALLKPDAKAAANMEANAGKTAGEAGSGETQKSGKGTSVESSAAKTTAPNLHPTRAAHFADFLEGFGGSNAIHRPADILAGLDRPVMASALNRAPETLRPTPLQMLPIEIGMQAVRGVTNFQIRLDPAELGRVDVKLQIRENGEVNASLVVDRVETLQMLRRDASTLQNAFEQAGLKQSPDGLSFSLRGEGREGQQQDQRAQGGSAVDALDEVALQAQIGDAVMRRVHIPNSSIDRMV